MIKIFNKHPVLIAFLIFLTINIYEFFRGDYTNFDPTAKNLAIYFGPQAFTLSLFAAVYYLLKKQTKRSP